MHRPLAAPMILAFAFLISLDSHACTIFKITLHGRTYLGNNEAWTDGNTNVWFLVAEPGKYGRVIFGYRNGYAQGGMNERGLAYDWVAGYKAEWKRDDAKPDFAGNFGEFVLEQAATVEEAISLFEKYNEPDLAGARTLLADKSGASAIVSWQDGKLRVARDAGKWQALGWEEAATLTRLQELEQSLANPPSRPATDAAPPRAGHGSTTASAPVSLDRRHATAANAGLASSFIAADAGAAPNAAAADAVIDEVGAVLSACQQSGKYTTFYSNVYDLSAGDVHVYQVHNRIPVVRFNLQRELARGNHYYDLPKLAEQIDRPPATDGRTQPRVAVDPAGYAALAGRYAIAGQGWLDVLNRDGRLVVQFPGDRAYELTPASATKFFLAFVDVQLTFTLDAAGVASDVAVHTWEKDLTGVRIQSTSSPATAPTTSRP